jgi:F1F0 ATPase subunit 2
VTEFASAAVGVTAGTLLGGVFFGGLWWTVRRALARGAAGAWFAGSYLLRFAIVAGGLYALAHDDAVRGIAAGFGLIVARLVLARSSVRSTATTADVEHVR